MRKDEFISKCEVIANEYGIYGIIPYIIDGVPDENGRYPIRTESIPANKMTMFEAGKIYDFLEEHDLFKKEVTEVAYPTPTSISEILIVEDGSCDVDDLKKQGYKVIVYRQGSTPPYFIEDKRRRNEQSTCNKK